MKRRQKYKLKTDSMNKKNRSEWKTQYGSLDLEKSANH